MAKQLFTTQYKYKALIYSLIIGMPILLMACQNNNTHQTSTQIQPNPQTTTTPKAQKSNSSPVFENGFNHNDYPISIRQISFEEFDKLSQDSHNYQLNYSPEENLTQAKSQLKDKVEFNRDGSIKQINFNNGGIIKNPAGRFVAYYDNDDDNKNILVLKDGNVDISYNLNTGKSTNKVGNPNQTHIASPDKTYRLIGYLNGQGCSNYFIQKRINHEWVKIIELNDIFNKFISSHDGNLCHYDGSVFLTENKAYIVQANDNKQELTTIYEITLKDEQTFKTLDLNTIPTKSLPLKVEINFDNYQSLIKLNRTQAKFFAGLYPNVEEIYLLGKVNYQTSFTNLIVSFKTGEEISTELITIDKDNNIIDNMMIAYDEVADSSHRAIGSLQKDYIIVQHYYMDELVNKSIHKIDNQGYFLSTP